MGKGPKRHFIIPDTQTRPGVPLEHLDWIGAYIADKKPDVIIHLGDHWDFPSLNGHEEPGSLPMENKRYADDLAVGNAAFKRIDAPISAEVMRLRSAHRKRWEPRKVFLLGNHEARADRIANNNPKYLGALGSFQCDTLDWERHEFQEPVLIDGIYYCHFFSNTGTGKPIGGDVPNRLAKINASFVQGHEQGKREGNRVTSTGRTLYGLVLGSCYLHREEYRGPHQRHWRGVAMLSEVVDGEYDRCEISLKYLCRKYEGMELHQFCKLKYPNGSWDHLA